MLSPSFDGEIMVSDAGLPPAAGSRADYATSAALDPTQLPPAGRDFARRFRAEYGRAPGRYAAYGYEAMALDPRLDRPRLGPRRPRVGDRRLLRHRGP